MSLSIGPHGDSLRSDLAQIAKWIAPNSRYWILAAGMAPCCIGCRSIAPASL